MPNQRFHLNPVPWPSGTDVADQNRGRHVAFHSPTVFAALLRDVRPETVSAQFLTTVDALTPYSAGITSVDFVPSADIASLAATSLTVHRQVPGTEPGISLVAFLRHQACDTPEIAVYLDFLATLASRSCPDLSRDHSHGDNAIVLARRCRELSDELDRARSLLEFLGETSRTFLTS